MKRNEIIVYEHKKGVKAVKYNAKPQGHIEPPKPRNPVAKNAGAAIGGGAAGAHKDAKKASQAVRGQKHKNAEMAEGDDPLQNRADYAKKHGQGQVYKKTYPGDKVGMTKSYAYDVKRTGPKGHLPKEGVAEGSLNEMDSQGYKGHRGDEDPGKGPEKYVKPAKFKNVAKDAGKKLNRSMNKAHKKQGVAEGNRYSSYHDELSRRERDEQDYMDRERRDFKRQELQHELGHESNNIQVVINGKRWKVFPGKGYADSAEERMNLRKMQQWAERKSAATGKKWEVYLTGANPTVSEMGSDVGKITKVDPMTKKATVTKADGSTMDVDSTALKPTADGKMQMDAPETDEIKPGTQVVSTEMMTPTDSRSPIPGDNDHDEISKLLVHRLRRLAGL